MDAPRTPMTGGELRARRAALLALVAVVLASWIAFGEQVAWAMTSGAFIGLALAVWSLLAYLPSRRDGESREPNRDEQHA